MAERHDAGALLAQYHPLPRGPRVCLRLARRRDLAGIANLYDRQGLPVDELSLARLVSFDLFSVVAHRTTILNRSKLTSRASDSSSTGSPWRS